MQYGRIQQQLDDARRGPHLDSVQSADVALKEGTMNRNRQQEMMIIEQN